MRQDAEAVSVLLLVLCGQSQAQLDGFKSHELRAEVPAQRHLYTTEWRQIEVADGAVAEVLAPVDAAVAATCARAWAGRPPLQRP